ncbi:MAG: DUF402 domain-containing protein [Caldilineales bacterium]|nr:DUF402 domain-containing protein [Caldilineales bacterium]
MSNRLPKFPKPDADFPNAAAEAITLPTEARPITVHKADADGHIVTSYQGWLLAAGAAVVVLARWTKPTLVMPYVSFDRGDLLFETFYPDRYYNVFALYDGSGLPLDWSPVEPLNAWLRLHRRLPVAHIPTTFCREAGLPCRLKGYYVNFTNPIRFQAEPPELVWRDLALDLWIPAAGAPQLLDEAEYQALELATRDPQTHAAVQTALAHLWQAAQQHGDPMWM